MLEGFALRQALHWLISSRVLLGIEPMALHMLGTTPLLNSTVNFTFHLQDTEPALTPYRGDPNRAETLPARLTHSPQCRLIDSTQ